MIKDKIRAMVLAAGVGSRLQPLSEEVPKPLIRIGGRTIMDHILLLLKQHGITNVISNTHHLASQIHQHFKDIKNQEGIDIQFVYEEKLSGVAGGIRKCKDFLKESTACIIMGDALTDIDLTYLYDKHKEAVNKHNCLVSIAQMQIEDTKDFGVIVTESLLEKDSSTPNRVVKFQEKPNPEEALSKWANTGIYFFEPRVYDYIPGEEKAPKYDVAKDLFPKLIEAGEYIQAINVNGTYWADLGTPSQYIQSVRDIANNRVKLQLLPGISPQAKIHPSAKILGNNEIGSNSTINENVEIYSSVIWDNVEVSAGSKLKHCIIGSGVKIPANSELNGAVLTNQSKLVAQKARTC